MSYASLALMVVDCFHSELAGAGGEWYPVEYEIMWDGRPNENIRVIGAIDDGKWRAFSPLTESFVVTAAGEFVAE